MECGYNREIEWEYAPVDTMCLVNFSLRQSICYPFPVFFYIQMKNWNTITISPHEGKRNNKATQVWLCDPKLRNSFPAEGWQWKYIIGLSACPQFGLGVGKIASADLRNSGLRNKNGTVFPCDAPERAMIYAWGFMKYIWRCAALHSNIPFSLRQGRLYCCIPHMHRFFLLFWTDTYFHIYFIFLWFFFKRLVQVSQGCLKKDRHSFL